MTEKRWWTAFAIVAIAIGIFLRVDQLGIQILLDDEWHAIHKLLASDYRDIATHFGLADYCIPLTLLYKFFALHGGLTEFEMHLPPLLCGIGLMIVSMGLPRRNPDMPTRAVWTALMAISPLMTYHSRTARPYAITTLLVFVAVIAFYEAMRGERRARWATLYVICAALAGWFHLVTLPFTLSPFLFFGVVALVDAIKRRSLRLLVFVFVLGIATVALLAVALLPPIVGDWQAITGKTGTDSITLESLYRTLLLCFGTAHPLVWAAMIVAFVLGAWQIARRDAMFAGYLGCIVAASAVAIAAMHPAWIQHQGAFARYLQPAVPFLLLAVAAGITFVLSTLRGAPLQTSAAAISIAGLFVAGPMPEYLYDPNQFMGHAYFQFDYDPAHNPYRTGLPQGPISAFYRKLGEQPPRSLTLIETPWSLETPSDPHELYQRVHRQYIKIAMSTPECGVYTYGNIPESENGIRFREFVHVSGLLRGETYGGDFLVVHLHAWPTAASAPTQWPDIGVCLPKIESRFGTPVFRDDEIEVFALSDAARAIMH
ncbi:MAG TPA: hypothetical protein VH082_13245 [Rudaea sp.]|jgi:hypothetical protein|nr:hypothetical protein [Rudaea sp.]